MNPHSANGPDDIPNLVLKRCASSISPFLVILFNKSLHHAILPKDWKLANITPIHKEGDKGNVHNYRPLSLTSVCCKTLEHIIYSGLMKHLQDNDFFTATQHGFRSGLSCTTQLTEFTHDITLGINNSTQIDAVFLDLKKAFDVVSHNLLLFKLSSLGIPERLLSWIKDYLHMREQRVVVNGASSSPVEVLSGVPQGSVLGPLLFLIFINDMPADLKSTVRLYADDCVIYLPVTCINDAKILQADLDAVTSWCDKWKMSLNIKKCYHVKFTNKINKLVTAYRINETALQMCDEVRYLGVTFSSTMNWSAHVDAVVAKASRMLYFFQRNFKHAPTGLKETLYVTNIRPVLEYACQSWDPFTNKNIDKLERVQKRASRFVTANYDFTVRSSSIVDGLGWKTLAARRKVLRLKFLFNIISDKTGINKHIYIKEPHYITARRDNQRKIRPYQCRIDVFKYSFFPNTIEEWNALPSEVVAASDFYTAIDDFVI